MKIAFTITNILLGLWLFAAGSAPFTVSRRAAFAPGANYCDVNTTLRDTVNGALPDTVKYQGYRLDLTNFELLKKNEDWLRLRFTVINSGRKDVDYGKEGTAHWVQVNFDPSIFELKLGGYREHILYELAKLKFALPAGKMLRDFELKVSTNPPPAPKKQPEVIAFQENPAAQIDTFSPKGGTDEGLPDDEYLLKSKEECPDLLFSAVKILEQDDKWATIEYTIINQGKGIFFLLGEQEILEDNLSIRAFISGVPVLSKGALPVGGEFLKDLSGNSAQLQPGETFTGKIRLDIRKKTRYMKSLILSLDSPQLSLECEMGNNNGAVILE